MHDSVHFLFCTEVATVTLAQNEKIAGWTDNAVLVTLLMLPIEALN